MSCKLTITILSAITVLYAIPTICSADARAKADVDVRSVTTSPVQNNFIAPEVLFDIDKAISDLEQRINQKDCDIFRAKKDLEALKASSSLTPNISKKLIDLELKIGAKAFEMLKQETDEIGKKLEGQDVVYVDTRAVGRNINRLKSLSHISNNNSPDEKKNIEGILKRLRVFEAGLANVNAIITKLESNQSGDCSDCCSCSKCKCVIT